MNHEYIQKLGAAAARKGLTLWDCPYYRATQMPGHTGESIAEWRSKVEAWEAGWTDGSDSRALTDHVGHAPQDKSRHQNG